MPDIVTPQNLEGVVQRLCIHPAKVCLFDCFLLRVQSSADIVVFESNFCYLFFRTFRFLSRVLRVSLSFSLLRHSLCTSRSFLSLSLSFFLPCIILTLCVSVAVAGRVSHRSTQRSAVPSGLRRWARDIWGGNGRKVGTSLSLSLFSFLLSLSLFLTRSRLILLSKPLLEFNSLSFSERVWM